MDTDDAVAPPAPAESKAKRRRRPANELEMLGDNSSKYERSRASSSRADSYRPSHTPADDGAVVAALLP